MFHNDEKMVIVYLQHWYISLAYGELIDFNTSSSVVDAGHLDEWHTKQDEVVREGLDIFFFMRRELFWYAG